MEAWVNILVDHCTVWMVVRLSGWMIGSVEPIPIYLRFCMRRLHCLQPFSGLGCQSFGFTFKRIIKKGGGVISISKHFVKAYLRAGLNHQPISVSIHKVWTNPKSDILALSYQIASPPLRKLEPQQKQRVLIKKDKCTCYVIIYV